MYSPVVYPGIFIAGKEFSGYSQEKVKTYFTRKNENIQATTFTFKVDDHIATISAAELGAGYDADLLANQAYSLGKSDNLISNISIILQAYLRGVSLEPSYRYSADSFEALIKPIEQQVNIAPVDAQFSFENGKVQTFQLSSNGKAIDQEKLKEQLSIMIANTAGTSNKKNVILTIPVTTIKPKINNEEVNNMEITELVASGTSLFEGSIPNRIHNITVSAGKINGVLIKPGEVFSFARAVGDISTLTGYKQAYVIQNGRTVLGDGGGVCQVSTTLFRAALNAGLPIIERNQHAYRVHYYEEDSPPGIDAAVYVPSVDLKFKNDTTHHLLIQSYVDPYNYRLTFELYGTKDDREIIITKPVIVSQSPAPEPLHQDDPNLPKGEVKQVDWAAAGAKVYFTREVRKNGKVVISDTFNSNYRPWQAIFLHGTKEG